MDFPSGRFQPSTPQKPTRDTATAKPVAAPTPMTPVSPQHHTTTSGTHTPDNRSKKRPIVPIIIGIIVLLALIAGALYLFKRGDGGAPDIDSSKYQAVFFTDGKYYFGKLKSKGDYFTLTDIYYIQTQTQSGNDATKDANNQQATTDQNNVQLIKLGKELHGPEDEMVINKDQVQFYENLKSDGKVVQKIQEFQQQ